MVLCYGGPSKLIQILAWFNAFWTQNIFPEDCLYPWVNQSRTPFSENSKTGEISWNGNLITKMSMRLGVSTLPLPEAVEWTSTAQDPPSRLDSELSVAGHPLPPAVASLRNKHLNVVAFWVLSAELPLRCSLAGSAKIFWASLHLSPARSQESYPPDSQSPEARAGFHLPTTCRYLTSEGLLWRQLGQRVGNSLC